MTRAFSSFTLLLVLALLLAPALAQRGNGNRADAAHRRANDRVQTVMDARVNGRGNGRERANARVDARADARAEAIDAAAFRADTARNKGERIDGEFILQLQDDCETRCRGELQKAVNDDPNTRGCTVGKKVIRIGETRFVNVKCPTGRNLRRDKVDSAVRSVSRTQDVPQITLVEEDFVVTLDSVPTSLWGVDETDGGVTTQGPSYLRDGLRTCGESSNNGQDVDIWVLDTGCTPTYGGKCTGYYGGSNPCFDGHGHGSHVGGTATDGLYGVAPNARKNCVKVLNDRGSGSYFIAISAIEYVVNNRGPKGNIINFSLSGPYYAPLNNAVEAAADEGIYFTLAAGNAQRTVCDSSPGSAVNDKVFTVQAHDIDLGAAWFTNYATVGEDCTHISAPGVDITSFGGTVSGTSMAAPHVAGAIALLISDDRQPSLAALTATGVGVGGGGFALRKPSVGIACT